jgi:hypothetical protein
MPATMRAISAGALGGAGLEEFPTGLAAHLSTHVIEPVTHGGISFVHVIDVSAISAPQ